MSNQDRSCGCSDEQCAMLTTFITEHNDSLWTGKIRVKNKVWPKIIVFRKKLKKFLGIPNDTLDYTIVHHHLSAAFLATGIQTLPILQPQLAWQL